MSNGDEQVLDVTDVFPGCVRAERRGLHVLILRKLPNKVRRMDGHLGRYEIEYRWLSQLDPELCCVKGQEFSYWKRSEIGDPQAGLFENFQLF